MDEAVLSTVVVVIVIVIVVVILRKTIFSDWGFGTGSTVEITGLISRCELNGAWGIVKGQKNGRHSIQIEGEQTILAKRVNLKWHTEGVPTRGDRIKNQSEDLLVLHNSTLVASRNITSAVTLLSDKVLIAQNSAAQETARQTYRIPYLSSSFPVVDAVTPKQWSVKVSSPAFVTDNGIGHPAVISEFSSLLRASTVDNSPNSVLSIVNEKMFITSVKDIKRGETITLLSCDPHSMCSSHGHFTGKHEDLRGCIATDISCDCDHPAVILGGKCFFCHRKFDENEIPSLAVEERWMSTLVYNMIVNPSKYSLTQSAACFTLLHSTVGILHWAAAASSLLILENSCSGLHSNTKLGLESRLRIRNIINYLYCYCSFHDNNKRGTGFNSPGIKYMLTTRLTGRSLLRSLNETDKDVCRQLCCMLCPGVVFATWSCSDQNIYKNIMSKQPEECQNDDYWWSDNPIPDYGVDIVRVKTAVTKLTQSIKSNTNPLSDPYSHNQQSMDGHIDQILHGMGYDRGLDGEHDTSAYMSLLSKLSHGDDMEDRMREEAKVRQEKNIDPVAVQQQMSI